MVRHHHRGGAQRTPFLRDDQQHQQHQQQQQQRGAREGGSRLAVAHGAGAGDAPPTAAAGPRSAPAGEAGGSQALPWLLEGVSDPLPMSEASVDAALRVIEVLGALGASDGAGWGAGGVQDAEQDASSVRCALLADAPLAQHVVQMLLCSPGEQVRRVGGWPEPSAAGTARARRPHTGGTCVVPQVLASTLLALQALDHSAVKALAGGGLAHSNALLDCLGELPFGEQGVRCTWLSRVQPRPAPRGGRGATCDGRPARLGVCFCVVGRRGSASWCCTCWRAR